MPLSTITNTFAGNPLDRASERRGDADWLRARLDDPETLAVALWNGRPLVEDGPAASRRCASPTADQPGARDRRRRRAAAVHGPVARDRGLRHRPGGHGRPGRRAADRPRPVRGPAGRSPCGCRPRTRRSWPRPRACSNGAAGTASARPAASRPWPSTAAGSGCAKPAAPSISRAPTRW